MNVEYRDGRKESFFNQTAEQVAEMTARMTDPDGDVEAVEAYRQPKSTRALYPDNRAGRRKWLHDKRREGRA